MSKKINNLFSFKFLIILFFLILILVISIFNIKGNSHSHDFHIHADFLVSLNGEIYNFTNQKYMSDGVHLNHEYVHLHDNNPFVIHYHKENITLGSFFHSLNMNLTNDSFSTLNKTYTTNQTHIFEVYVNQELIENPQNYVANDLDRILIVYYQQNISITHLFDQVTNLSCIYSLKCPERGEPPESSCLTGSTCAVDIEWLV